MRGAALALALLAACSSGSDGLSEFGSTESPPPATAVSSTGPSAAPADVVVAIDPRSPGDEISPLILGVSGDLSASEMRDAGITLDSWGGNPASRFNYMDGRAWNAAADWEFRNTDYGWTVDAFRAFSDINAEASAATRVVVPTLGWVARDGDDRTCSFPDDEGGCTGGAGANCEAGGPIADPTRTSVESSASTVAEWIEQLLREGRDLPFIAMDNEPDLWGHTHYDVHPQCPTFQEIVDTYLEYATAIRAVAPDSALMGPVMCCWYDYWNIGPGAPDGSGDDFLTWFLEQVRDHDERTGIRTLDVVDVHFYPQSEVFNDDDDPETNARRLRSTRALWDNTYVDESWIRRPIMFIPRMKRIIEATYPGTPLAITEWNFGNDRNVNGALAIADALGTFGREGVYLAAYWRSPPADSPGFFAFKLFGNYDDAGARFGGRTVPAVSSDGNAVTAYGAVEGDVLRVVVVNKQDAATRVGLDVEGSDIAVRRRFRYGSEDLSAIIAVETRDNDLLTVPGHTIELLELDLIA